MLNATSLHIEIGSNVTISADAKLLAASYDKEKFIMTGERLHNYWVLRLIITSGFVQA